MNGTYAYPAGPEAMPLGDGLAHTGTETLDFDAAFGEMVTDYYGPERRELTGQSRIEFALGDVAVPPTNEVMPEISAELDAEQRLNVQQLLLHSLKIRGEQEAFDKAYAALGNEEKAAFDEFEASEYRMMEKNIGREKLEALNIAKPKLYSPPLELIAPTLAGELDPDEERGSSTLSESERRKRRNTRRQNQTAPTSTR